MLPHIEVKYLKYSKTSVDLAQMKLQEFLTSSVLMLMLVALQPQTHLLPSRPTQQHNWLPSTTASMCFPWLLSSARAAAFPAKSSGRCSWECYAAGWNSLGTPGFYGFHMETHICFVFLRHWEGLILFYSFYFCPPPTSGGLERPEDIPLVGSSCPTTSIVSGGNDLWAGSGAAGAQSRKRLLPTDTELLLLQRTKQQWRCFNQ